MSPNRLHCGTESQNAIFTVLTPSATVLSYVLEYRIGSPLLETALLLTLSNFLRWPFPDFLSHTSKTRCL
jgi:hypothetical protein